MQSAGPRQGHPPMRRGTLWAFAASLAATWFVLSGMLAATPAAAFDLRDVAAKAQQLARENFQEPKGQVPEWLLKISYDQWRDIRFRPDRALWADRPSPFRVHFFHPGLFYDRAVAINVVEAHGVDQVHFSPSQFDYGENDFASQVPQNLGYSGFRVHYPIKTASYFDEVIVFLGASYFRAVGKRDVFGLSARGLAIDTAAPWGEEFPYFREFWLVSPSPGAKDVAIYALLDSPSLTGAYRFVVYPGEETTVRVECQLFARKKVRKLGVAPLTSMFFHGENTDRYFPDFRPEVHDSDGLLLRFSSGEWLWRPLQNPKSLQVNAFVTDNPRGLGLLQRDRDFSVYQDLETRPDLRPSVWIEPEGDWGRGHVELVEIPTTSDTNDNIVSYWVPEEALTPEKPAAYAYVMHWYGTEKTRPPGGRVVATRRDSAAGEDTQRYVVDFEGGNLERIPADRVVRGVLTVVGGEEGGEILEQQTVKNTVTGGWRLTFRLRPKEDAVGIRAYLEKEGETLTETWSYVASP